MGQNIPVPGGQATGATCSNPTEFALPDAVNAFSSVVPYLHSLTKAEDQECYICSSCNRIFADAEGTVLLGTRENPAAKNPAGLFYVLSFLAGTACASGVFVLVLRRKKSQ